MCRTPTIIQSGRPALSAEPNAPPTEPLKRCASLFTVFSWKNSLSVVLPSSPPSDGSSTRLIRSLTSTRTGPPCPGWQKRTRTCHKTRLRWSARSDLERWAESSGSLTTFLITAPGFFFFIFRLFCVLINSAAIDLFQLCLHQPMAAGTFLYKDFAFTLHLTISL